MSKQANRCCERGLTPFHRFPVRPFPFASGVPGGVCAAFILRRIGKPAIFAGGRKPVPPDTQNRTSAMATDQNKRRKEYVRRNKDAETGQWVDDEYAKDNEETVMKVTTRQRKKKEQD